MIDIKKDTAVEDIIKIGKECDKCNHCCSYGSGALVGDDAKKIADFLNITQRELEEKYLEPVEKYNTSLLRPKLNKKSGIPYGKCVFLDKKDGCKIHEVKPLQCKIGNCKEHGEKLSIWFTLNYFVNIDDPESIRQWNTYLKTGGKTIKGGTIFDLVPDRNKLKKIINYEKLR